MTNYNYKVENTNTHEITRQKKINNLKFEAFEKSKVLVM
jgi:hypothetical protein